MLGALLAASLLLAALLAATQAIRPGPESSGV